MAAASRTLPAGRFMGADGQPGDGRRSLALRSRDLDMGRLEISVRNRHVVLHSKSDASDFSR
jgi:hypothetical protein